MSTVTCNYELSYTVTFKGPEPGEVESFAEELRRYSVNRNNVDIQGDVVIVKTTSHLAPRTRETIESALADTNHRRQGVY